MLEDIVFDFDAGSRARANALSHWNHSSIFIVELHSNQRKTEC